MRESDETGAQRSGRQIPRDERAEQAVLGAMLTDPGAADQALAALRPEDFYNPANQQIFAAMRALSETGTQTDMLMVARRLEQDGKLYDGGFDYLSRLAQDVLSTAHADRHIELVREKSALRRLMEICIAAARECQDGKTGAGELIARTSDEIGKIAAGSARGDVMHIRDAVADAYKQIADAHQAAGGILGVPTGFPRMDGLLSGFQGGQLIVIAGRPGMGKTSFAMNIVEHAAMKAGATCLVFSMEMSAAQLAGRLLCSDARVDMQLTRTGRMRLEDFERMGESIRRISNAPIYIDDSANIAVAEMTAKARRLQRTAGLGMIVIDYLQLMNTGAGRAENRTQEISQITRALKIMAKELNVPVALLSQLRRTADRTDGGKFPKLSDLRESGSIEQDADCVIFLHREDYDPERRTEENVGQATILIAKQRNGPTGPINVRWDGEYTRYVEIDETRADEEAPI